MWENFSQELLTSKQGQGYLFHHYDVFNAHFEGWSDDVILCLTAIGCIPLSEDSLVRERLIKTIRDLDYVGLIAIRDL